MCPPPNSPLPCQRHNDYIYATAHIHDVHGCDLIEHDRTPVVVDPGFEIAPGDASDVEVTNAHAWGSLYLVFSDGQAAATALGIAEDRSETGTAFLMKSLFSISW